MNRSPELHTSESNSQHRYARLQTFAGAALLVVLAIYALYFLILLAYSQAVLQFPFDYDQGEGFELYDAIRLSRGEHIYLDNTQYPFYSSNYPPVYRLMVAPLMLLFGPHLWVARATALVCTLLTGVLIFLAARRQMDAAFANHAGIMRWLNWRQAIAFVAALAYFAANYVYQIAPLARAHLPMVMFAFAGILLLDIGMAKTEATNPQRSRYFVIAGVALLLVAGFTKLQAVDALAAGFFFLLLRNWRWFIRALLISLIVTAVIVLVLNVWTEGQFWINVVTANVNEYDIQQTWFVYGQWFQLQGVLIVCSVGYVVWDSVRAIQQRSFQPITIWSLYFVAGAALGMLTGKWGAGPVYLIAAIAASLVCTVGFANRIASVVATRVHSTDNARLRLRTAILLLLCSAFFGAQSTRNVHLPTSGRIFGTIAAVLGVQDKSSYPPYPYYDAAGYTQLGHLLDRADTANGLELVRIVQSAEGPVWSEEAMFTLLAGKDVVTNPTQLYNLSKGNQLDTRRMIEMIDDQAFGAVIFRAQFYPQDVLIAIGRNYHWAQAVRMNGFDYQILLPNGANHER